MSILGIENLNYKRTMYEVDFKIKGTLFIDADSEDEIREEMTNLLTNENKRKFLIELMRSATSKDIEIDKITEIF